MVRHRPNQIMVYESPAPKAGWHFPEVENDSTLEWCLPWTIISEYGPYAIYATLRDIQKQGRFWNPISVWTLPDGSYRLWHGKSRYVWSKVFPNIKCDVRIIDHYDVDVTKRFPDAKVYSGDNITIDYEKRTEDGKTVFKGVLRNGDRHYRDDWRLMQDYGTYPEFDEIQKTKGVRYFHKGKFMFRWGNEDNSVDYHYDNIVDCMRFTCKEWDLL